jgi:hypothetical protein
VKFKSQLVTQVSGSIGGLTGSHNAAGMYFRARAVPVNPSSVLQNARRNQTNALAALWSTTLTEVQREQWRSYAANTPLISNMGEPQYVSGFAHFARSIYARDLAAGCLASPSTVVDAPGVNLLATGTPPTAAAPAPGDYEISVAFTNTDDWATEVGGAMLVFAGRPQNIGRNFFKGGYQFLGCVAGAAEAPISPEALDYPWDGDDGQKVFGYVRFLRADLRLSSKIYWQTAFAIA